MSIYDFHGNKIFDDEEMNRKVEELLKKFEEYVKKTDYATSTEAGVVKVGGDSAGVKINNDKMLVIAGAGVSEINAQESANRPITPLYLKYAIKTGLTKNDLEWTEEEKALARQLIGAGTSEVDTYTREEIDGMFGRYVNDVARLLGGIDMEYATPTDMLKDKVAYVGEDLIVGEIETYDGSYESS